jgi:translation initiation factor 6 (eIF-6)
MFKRRRGETRTYEDERQRLLAIAYVHDPTTKEYALVMAQIDKLDQIAKRSSEKLKTVIPACVTAVSLVGIYAVQQFAGIVVPKAMDAIASRSNREPREKD